jgi:hypothetical protein
VPSKAHCFIVICVLNLFIYRILPLCVWHVIILDLLLNAACKIRKVVCLVTSDLSAVLALYFCFLPVYICWKSLAVDCSPIYCSIVSLGVGILFSAEGMRPWPWPFWIANNDYWLLMSLWIALVEHSHSFFFTALVSPFLCMVIPFIVSGGLRMKTSWRINSDFSADQTWIYNLT